MRAELPREATTRAAASADVIRLATGAAGAALSLAVACPAVAVAGMGAIAGQVGSGRAWRVAAAAVLLACAIAFVASFLVDHEVPRWSMLAFALAGLGATLAAALADLPRALLVARAQGAGFLTLAAFGAWMAARPSALVCVAASVAVAGSWLVQRVWRGA